MRIVSLAPYITELIESFKLEDSLVAVSGDSVLTKEAPNVLRVTGGENADFSLADLPDCKIDLEKLKSVNPDLILLSYFKKPNADDVTREDVLRIQAQLSVNLGKEVKAHSYAPRRLEEIFDGVKELARVLKAPHKGTDLAGKVKAQIMDWADNFYERMKNKKAVIISSLDPLMTAGWWLPDIIQSLSAQPVAMKSGAPDQKVSWRSLVELRPDVLIVAPRGFDLKRSMQSFKYLEKLEDWETIPAVKRGEVIFADGINNFYAPGNSMIATTAILVSAMAGLESGYITPRDSFYRVRWLELQRHKI